MLTGKNQPKSLQRALVEEKAKVLIYKKDFIRLIKDIYQCKQADGHVLGKCFQQLE